MHHLGRPVPAATSVQSWATLRGILTSEETEGYQSTVGLHQKELDQKYRVYRSFVTIHTKCL